MGVDGFKADAGADCLGDSVTTRIGRISKSVFKRYYYADIIDHALRRNPQAVMMARPYATDTGAFESSRSKCTVGWCGDVKGDWNGFAQQVMDIYRSSRAGYGMVGAEIGGYKPRAVPDKILLIRWAQFGALTPLMENGGINGGETNHLPWFHDEETVEIYKYYATLHTELAPYFFSYGVEAHLKGLSIIRSPDIKRVQHRLGKDLFVSVLTSSSKRI